MALRLARLLNVEGIPNAFTFALMQGLLIFALALPVTVVPLRALDLLGSAQAVSSFYLHIGIVSLAGALGLPIILERLGRVRMMVIGLACVTACGVLYPVPSVTALYVATILYTFGFFAVEIVLNIVIMERITRRSFLHFEALRMGMLGVGFALGPWLGVKLSGDVGPWSPFAAMAAVTLLVGIWSLARRFVTSAAGSIRGHGNPLRFIPRFVRQPRILVAYVLALTRSSWWNTFFIYAPIYCVNNGYSEEDAGLVVSLGALFVVPAPFWGRIGARFGVRRHLIIGYVATGIAAAAATALAGFPTAGIAMLLVACLCASWLDAVGNAPFVRAVHPHERTEMTSLYTTYRDFGRIVPQGVFTALLLIFPLPAVFVCAGIGMLVGAWYSRYIPARY